MYKSNSIILRTPKISIFKTAANLELWAGDFAALPLHSFS